MDIRAINLTKAFDQNKVFENLNITIEEGRMNCLMGASGSGKTTLTNLLLGLQKPDSGELKEIQNKRFATVFQEDRLIEHWDAVKNIRLVCDKNISTDIIEQELAKVGLEEIQHKPVQSLSGGMRRRVALVRAILAKSDILVLDEPFKGLDEELKKKVIDYVKQSTKGKTVLVVTHDKEEVLMLEARLITLQ